jgi:disulfide bond formation protein DsbB
LIHHPVLKHPHQRWGGNEMARDWRAAVLGAAAVLVSVLCWPLAAVAGSITMTNTTAITAYSLTSPYAYFGGANPYVAVAPVGASFYTPTLTVQADAVGGNVVLTLEYATLFPGTMVVNGQIVSNADIFLGNGSGFSYAIALGYESQNGGMAAGLYSVGAYATSMDIWGTRPGFAYGGAYGTSAAVEPGAPGYSASLAPTVLTAGTYLSAATVTDAAMGDGWYQLAAQVTLTPAQAAGFADGLEIFWGTGDCGNGSFDVDVAGLPMAEPCSAAVFAAGVFYLLVKRRQGRPSFLKKRSKKLLGFYQGVSSIVSWRVSWRAFASTGAERPFRP